MLKKYALLKCSKNMLFKNAQKNMLFKNAQKNMLIYYILNIIFEGII